MDIEFGETKAFAITSSSATKPVPSGAVTASGGQGIVQVVMSPDGTGTIKGIGAGQTTLHFGALGFNSVTVTVNVAAIPDLVFTEGPVVSI